MQITEHFNREEFDCHDGTPYPKEWIEPRLKPLCEALEIIRKKLSNSPLHVISGYRTSAYNSKIPGAAKDSQHVQGKAADIVSREFSPQTVYQAVELCIKEKLIPEGGVGVYPSFVHYDIRGKKARWFG